MVTRRGRAIFGRFVIRGNRVLAGVALWGVLATGGNAADPQPYVTSLASTGEGDLDTALKASSDLLALQSTQAVGPFALAGRVRDEYDRLRTALESCGYYDGTVHIVMSRPKANAKAAPAASQPPSAPGAFMGDDAAVLNSPTIDGKSQDLANWIANVPKGEKVEARVSVDKGPLYHLGRITLKDDKTGEPPKLTPEQTKALGLATGQPAIAQTVLNGGGQLLDALREGGHALARVEKPVAYLRPETRTLDIVYPVTPGPVLNVGAISLEGLQKVHPAFIRRRLTVEEGQLYQPSKIEAARQNLTDLGVFSSVGVKDGSPTAVDGTMPLDFSFREGKRHAVGAEAGYSTDLGARAGVNWTHFNLLGNAERLRLVALVTGLGGSAQQGLGYDVYADLFKPDFLQRNQNLSARIEGLRQLFWSYRQTALLVRGGVARPLARNWNGNFGLAAEQESIEQFGVTRDYTILSAPLSTTFDNTGVGNPIEPATHGMRLSLGVTPSFSLGTKGEGTSFFAVMNASASTYFDLNHLGISKPGRSILAFRGTIGSIQGASTWSIPPDQRMYAGGSATVRGYRWQGVGPQYGDTRYAIGGTSIDAGSVEYRQRILRSFGMAMFADAGQVGETSMPFNGTLRVGTGAGVRYYTPIGPVRLDVAVPINRAPQGDKWDLYIGLGEAF